MMKNLNEEILKNYLSGKCSEEELQEIHSFIFEDKEQAQRFFREEELWHLAKYDATITDEVLARAKNKLYARIEQEKAKKQKRLFMLRWRRYAAAIVLLMALGGGIAYWLYSAQPYGKMTIEMALGDAVKEVLLPDGTKVWLNNGTTLKYADDFSGKERVVFVQGEAYFEVARDTKKPFIVKSDAMQLRVLGTTFNFKNTNTCRVAEATLVEGEVEVKGNNNEGMVVLSPGQRAELNKSTGKFMVKQVDAKLDAVWRDDLIPFDRASLPAIAKTLERFYSIKIILSPNLSSDVTYSGVLKRRNSISDVLNSLKNSIPIDYKIVGSNIFISPKE